MKPNFTIGLILLSIVSCQAQIPNKEQQLIEATQAAQEDKRADATVYGYDTKGKLVLLREGTNELICIANDPNKEGFSAVCYHKELAEFMERGRVLRAEGKNPGEIDEIREEEVKSGKLYMPRNPTTLHVLYGKDAHYDENTKRVEGAQLRYVVYVPFATPESTGLPIRPLVPGGAWLMDPGTHKAHIMVTPATQH